MHKDFSATLNMPHTGFPMKASLVIQEPLRLQQWHQEYYRAIQDSLASRPVFTLYDGPPYANGPIHLGHAFNKILKDMISRLKVLDGYRVVCTPGWDCHGLPIELHGEQQHLLKENASQDWLAICRQHAQDSIDLQQHAFKRLGIFTDWDHAYKTMDFAFEAKTIEVLGQIWEQGYLVRALKPVHWCTACESTLAEAEFITLAIPSFSLYCAFNVLATHNIPELSQVTLPIAFIVWTTTPWNLSENQALAINKNHSFIYGEMDGKGYIMAQTCFHYLKNTQIPFFQRYQYVCTLDPQYLLDISVQHPFMERIIKTHHADFVTEAEHTTGVVHIAPAHGSDDFILGKQCGLSGYTSVRKNGLFEAIHPYFPNRHIFTVGDEVIQLLQERDQLIYIEKTLKQAPHCWRHKTPLIMLTTEQWFINLCYLNLQKHLKQHITTVTTTPAWGQALLDKMVSTRSQWCISRQRKWGVPLPFFTHKITGDLHPDTGIIFAKAAALVRLSGVEGYRQSDHYALGIEDAEYYVRGEDIVDVWFDSGCVPLVLKDQHVPFPADLIIEGIDQYRGWFQSSLILSSICENDSPYRHIISHSFVCDGEGNKMSKSLGNVISPQEVVDVYGADVLRIWVAFTDYTHEMAASHALMKLAADRYLKIRNTLRFFLATINDFDLRHLKDTQLFILALDQHILTKLEQTQAQLCYFYQRYELHKAAQYLFNFFVKDLSQVYITTVKERQYTSPKQSNEYISAQVTAYHILAYALRWLAPIIPFTIQEILDHCQSLGHVETVQEIMHLTWYHHTPVHQYDTHLNEQCWKELILLKEQCHQEYFALKHSPGKRLQQCPVLIACPPELYQLLIPMQSELHFFLGCASVHIIANEELTLHFEPLAYAHKCPRCWCYFKSLETVVCHRCVDNLAAQPKILRRYF